MNCTSCLVESYVAWESFTTTLCVFPRALLLHIPCTMYAGYYNYYCTTLNQATIKRLWCNKNNDDELNSRNEENLHYVWLMCNWFILSQVFATYTIVKVCDYNEDHPQEATILFGVLTGAQLLHPVGLIRADKTNVEANKNECLPLCQARQRRWAAEWSINCWMMCWAGNWHTDGWTGKFRTRRRCRESIRTN